MKRLLFGALAVLTLSCGASAQARIGLQHHRVESGMSPGMVAGLATLNTAIPIVAGAKMLYDEEMEGLGVALLAWGLVVGPAPFNLYYHDTTAGLVGLGVRAGCVLAATAAMSGGTWDEDGSVGTEVAVLALVAVSGVTTVLNIVGLPKAVRRYYAGANVTMAPWVTPQGGGLSVALRL